MENSDDLLIASCRTMIKTVLSCLDNATKGTIYKIGLMPELTAVRVLSGVKRTGASDEFEWGLPAVSDYNPPGKKWEQYRDQPGRPLEAMGWCVEKQMSWTAENPMHGPPERQKAALWDNRKTNFTWNPCWFGKRASTAIPVKTFNIRSIGRGTPSGSDTENVVAAVSKDSLYARHIEARRPFDQNRQAN